ASSSGKRSIQCNRTCREAQWAVGCILGAKHLLASSPPANKKGELLQHNNSPCELSGSGLLRRC
ncbi:MAG TPA: hypothetical protein PKM78_14160, partial [Anaerolineae bacterium]|nr:hypothetical protein [Anaerolineae bacterium]HNU04878.1 hypothetical protein [Anaerolineae bacterium]